KCIEPPQRTVQQTYASAFRVVAIVAILHSDAPALASCPPVSRAYHLSPCPVYLLALNRKSLSSLLRLSYPLLLILSRMASTRACWSFFAAGRTGLVAAPWVGRLATFKRPDRLGESPRPTA